ncbi:hypothetical protein EKH57_14540 [Halorubrum sp. BOL3-1]|uniref:hypothetical protein n=1 Tax=Halorubrum sp. BOL3-1 TaxID=2497325 RepID=UPI001004EDDC|nr:hypothetical protein [Halorubrum sp. BOL3-1]QAU14420.1 hypothetical protein EKH57_14540 [Halorubrum sp. BOL3-1]
MAVPDLLRTVVAVAVYWTATSLGGSVLLSDSTSPLADSPVPAVLGTVGLFGVLLVAYGTSLRRSAGRDASEPE